MREYIYWRGGKGLESSSFSQETIILEDMTKLCLYFVGPTQKDQNFPLRVILSLKGLPLSCI
jgi:hypothetical protein